MMAVQPASWAEAEQTASSRSLNSYANGDPYRCVCQRRDSRFREQMEDGLSCIRGPLLSLNQASDRRDGMRSNVSLDSALTDEIQGPSGRRYVRHAVEDDVE